MSLLPSFMTATVNEQVAANRTIIPKEYDIDFSTGLHISFTAVITFGNIEVDHYV